MLHALHCTGRTTTEHSNVCYCHILLNVLKKKNKSCRLMIVSELLMTTKRSSTLFGYRKIVSVVVFFSSCTMYTTRFTPGSDSGSLGRYSYAVHSSDTTERTDFIANLPPQTSLSSILPYCTSWERSSEPTEWLLAVATTAAVIDSSRANIKTRKLKRKGEREWLLSHKSWGGECKKMPTHISE